MSNIIRVAFNPFSTQAVFALMIAPVQEQDLAFGLVISHNIQLGWPLCFVRSF